MWSVLGSNHEDLKVNTRSVWPRETGTELACRRGRSGMDESSALSMRGPVNRASTCGNGSLSAGGARGQILWAKLLSRECMVKKRGLGESRSGLHNAWQSREAFT